MTSQGTANSFFSSFTQSLTSKASTLPDFNKRLNSFTQTIQQHARELPKNLTRLPEQLDSERQNFIKTKSSEEKKPQSELVLPWAGYDVYEKELKRRILEITKDQRHFTIPPPEDTTFEFDLKAYSQSARAILEVDQELSKMRFLLVPKQVDEVSFWRNYFYRVTTVKQAVLSEAPKNEPVEKEKDEVLFDFTIDSDDDDAEHSVEKDDKDQHKNVAKDGNDEKNDKTDSLTSLSTTKDNTQDELIKEDIKTDENEEGMEEWEIELRRAAKGL
ncbi:hypothetical protein BJ944DRAFT_252275 [Cunninghamella echinulata]|nr:hypothetical protein BJ944DRAFT_252275 [Cunninghamella echinulata]